MDLERDIEEKLINRLTQGVSQWTRRDDIKTVSQLWDNFFKILSKNNKAQLHDHPLTENEKIQFVHRLQNLIFIKQLSLW